MFLAVEVAFFYTIRTVYINRARDAITFELGATGDLFQSAIKNRLVPLSNASFLISKDYAFQKAFATGHQKTVLSAMTSLKTRVNADFMLLLGPENPYPVLYELPRTELSGQPFPFPGLVKAAEGRSQPLTTFFVLKGKLFSTMMVPLLAPETLAWICLGFQIDDGFAGSFRKLTRSDLSIFRFRGGKAEILASTLNPEPRRVLSDFLEAENFTKDIKTIILGKDRYIVQMDHLDPGNNLSYVLQQSLDEALMPYSSLFRNLSIITLAGVGLTIFLVVLIFSRMTKPLSEMIEVVTRFQNGDWSARVTAPAEDEIGQLAIVFNHLAEEVVQWQTSLEARVLERTTELEQARREAMHMMQDVDVQRQKAENALNDLAASTQSLNLLSRAIENSSATVIITNSEAVIEYVNPAFTKKTGYARNEVIGKNPRILQSGKTPPEVYREMWETIVTGMTWTGELCTRKKNGDLFWESVSISPVMGPAGEQTHFVAVKEDITERRETQEALRLAKEEAQEASLAKSQFLANMSHEIRTPMNAVIGYSFLVQKFEMSPEVRDYLRKIQNAGKSDLGLINDILDLSKIEAGRLTLENSEFPLEEVLINLSDVVFGRALQKELEFYFTIAPEVPTTLKGDQFRLTQVLINLATNSVKFTEKGEVEVSVLVLECSDTRIKLRFAVRDTGIGLSRKQMGSLFQAFTQADGSTTRKYGGTGLGLSISQKLVELMDGEIDLDSELGRGSTFFFSAWFDRCTPAGGELPPRILADSPILIVTGKPAFWEAMKPHFDRSSAPVTIVGSVREAVDLIGKQDENNPFKLALVDPPLPDQQGVEVPRLIKGKLSLRHPPAVAFLSVRDDSTLLRWTREGMVDVVIRKPIVPSVLMNSVLGILAPHLHTPPAPGTKDRNWHELLCGARVLLVEDNLINQEIATELLKQVGILVDLAGNGRHAVEMITTAQTPYDIVLMDVQMPEMDGLEATRRIRGDPRYASLPIIAMTAHALAEEKSHCLAVGMNDHIVKPIEVNAMYETLVRWYVAARPAAEVSTIPDGHSDVTAVEGLNVASGLERVGGNQTLYWKLVRRFAEEQETTCTAIAEAIEGENPAEAMRLVHSVKGVAGNLSAEAVHARAEELEQALKGGKSPENIRAAFNSFAESLKTLITNIKVANLDSTAEKESAPGKEQPAATTIPLSSTFAQDLVRLAAYLDNCDSELIDCFQKLKGDLKLACHADEFREMERAFNLGDFDRTLECLRRVATRLNIEL